MLFAEFTRPLHYESHRISPLAVLSGTCKFVNGDFDSRLYALVVLVALVALVAD
jgi:hypothetical protein